MQPEKYYFLMVSNDKYELPLCVAESVKELAEMTGMKPNSITVALLRGYGRGTHKRRKYKFIKVEISDEYDSAT